MNTFEFFDDIMVESIDDEIMHNMLLQELTILGKDIKIPDNIKKSISSLNIKSISDKSNKLMKSAVSKLEEAGIDVNSLKKDGVNTAKKMKNNLMASYKKGIPPKKAAEKFKLDLTSNVQKIIKKHVKKRSSVLSTGEDILFGIILLLTLVYVATVLSTICIIFFGKTTGGILSFVVVAPIVEEAAKSIALQKGITFGKIWTFGFASYEFYRYFMTMTVLGVSIPSILIARTLALMFHMTTANVQADFIKKDKTFMGYVVGVMLHAAWNTLPAIAIYG